VVYQIHKQESRNAVDIRIRTMALVRKVQTHAVGADEWLCTRASVKLPSASQHNDALGLMLWRRFAVVKTYVRELFEL
jgi:hypothetical protein